MTARLPQADAEAGVVTVEEAPETAAPELDLAALAAATPTGQGPDAVEATALNGAQIAAILEVDARVHAGEITRDAGLGILRLAFPGVAPEQLAAALPPAPAPAQPTTDDAPVDAEEADGPEPAADPEDV